MPNIMYAVQYTHVVIYSSVNSTLKSFILYLLF